MAKDGIIDQVTLLLGCGLTLAACAGGGHSAQPVDISAQSPDTLYTYVWFTDTGSTGPVAAPAAAVWGGTPPQIAVAGGPTISGSGQDFPAPATTFPVLTTGLQFSPGGSVSAIAVGHDANATVVDTAVDPCFGELVTTLKLVIPSANVNSTIFSYRRTGPSADPNSNSNALDYVALGTWATNHNSMGWPFGGMAGEFLLGYETPASAVPTSGQASYSGHVSGEVYAPINGHVSQALLNGKASLSADFISGAITGAFTGITYEGGGISPPAQHVTGPWNDISVSAAIATGSNRFSGSAVVTSAPQNPFSLSGSASGHIDGGFFGPAAQGIGAVWTLGDGNAAAVGGVTGAR